MFWLPWNLRAVLHGSNPSLPEDHVMSLPNYLADLISPDVRYFEVPGRFNLESGEALEKVVVAYQTWGDIANAAKNTILICHALTGSSDVDAWWPNIIGKGKTFDPATDFIVCANILGSCYGTTGPASYKPGSSKRYQADFPRISIRDMVNAERALLDHLGVDFVELVTGPSLGGMQALEWAFMYPERVGSVVPIGVGGRHSAWCIGISEAQRAAIAADPNWRGGYYSDERRPQQGLAAARMMAVCTYRSWQSFEERFGRETSDADQFQVQSYLQHQATKINDRFDANAYVTLTQAMHTHDLSRGRGPYPDVLAKVTQPALVVSVSSDALYPAHEQRYLATQLANASYEVLDCSHGHDGFLIETEALGGVIDDFRQSLRQAAPLVAVSGSR